MKEPIVFFGSRRFPPSTGGMETHSKAVHDALCRNAEVTAVTLGRGSYIHLVWFLPWLFVRAALALIRGVDVVVAGDPIVLAVLRPLLFIRRCPAVVFVYGLDLTFSNPLYHRVIRMPLRSADRVIAISRATASIATSVGIAEERVVIVPAASELVEIDHTQDDSEHRLRERFGLRPTDSALVTVGRLVPRKGVAWFVDQVMPRLPDDVHYLVAGSGPDHERIEAAVRKRGLQRRVQLLGRVDEADRELLLSGATIFVMPNVVVPNDMEGFGLVAVEAAIRGSVVVAAGIEGILDAVAHEETGVLVPSEDADAFQHAIILLLEDDQSRQAAAARYAAEAQRIYGPDATADRIWAAVAPVLR